MLWLALHFPHLPLEVRFRAADAAVPAVVSEKQGSRTKVAACNKAAAASGIRRGMPLSAAVTLTAGLTVCERDLASEQEALSGLAAWANRFTPAVSLQLPAGLLLEIGGCLRLHRGLDKLLEEVRSGLNEMGFRAASACAPTAHGAWLLAKAGKSGQVAAGEQLASILGELPVTLLQQPRDVVEGLELLGAGTLGDCLHLPRAGLARRFGKGLLEELDRALGKIPEARAFFVPSPQFWRGLELPATVEAAEGLLFAVRRLLPELESYLLLHQAGLQELELLCHHEDMPVTVVTLGLAEPARGMERILFLLREKLGRTSLPAPVRRIELKAQRILPLAGYSGDLFEESSAQREGVFLLERLMARLGKEAVSGIAPVADHRPERAWQPCPAGCGSGTPGNALWPLWLLPQPVPCRKDGLVLKKGPERIESGWWDGMDVARDYYQAQDRSGTRLWVYCDRTNGEWYVHGLFA